MAGASPGRAARMVTGAIAPHLSRLRGLSICTPMAIAQATAQTGRTAWARNLAAPVRDFLSTETGSAIVLLAATVAALLWANSPGAHYDSVWTTKLTIDLGGSSISTDLRHWINEGLMTFFFLVV